MTGNGARYLVQGIALYLWPKSRPNVEVLQRGATWHARVVTSRGKLVLQEVTDVRMKLALLRLLMVTCEQMIEKCSKELQKTSTFVESRRDGSVLSFVYRARKLGVKKKS